MPRSSTPLRTPPTPTDKQSTYLYSSPTSSYSSPRHKVSLLPDFKSGITRATSSASSRQHPTITQALLAPCLTSWEKFREKLVFPRQSQWDKCLPRDCPCCSKMWVSQRSAESTQAQEMQKGSKSLWIRDEHRH